MQIFKLFGSIVLTVGTGALAGWITAGESSSTWYQELDKPWFNPPPAVFAPVWTALYILMGIAFFLVWQRPKTASRQRAIYLFLFQLLLNFIWNPIFFKSHNLLLAVIDIILLLFFIVATIVAFHKISRAAAWLLVPYLLWVCFATVLTVTIWMGNT